MKWIRKHVVWIAATAVAGCLLWLVGTVVSLQTRGTPTAGQLFGKKVPLTDYLKARRAVEHQAILTHGDQYRQNVSRQQLESQTWERLMLLAEGKRLKIRIPDQAVVQFLQAQPLFQTEGGQFDSKGYETVVRYSLGISPRQFEEEIRDTLKIRALLQAAVKTPAPTESELRQAYRRHGEKIRVRFLILPQEGLAREVAHASAQDPSQMDRVAQQLDRTPVTTNPFQRQEQTPLLPLRPADRMALFEMEPGQVRGPLSSADGGWLVVHLLEKIPPAEEDFEAMKPLIERQLADQGRMRAYLSWYQDLLRRANPQRSSLEAAASGP